MTKEDIIEMIRYWENLDYGVMHFLQNQQDVPALMQVVLDDSQPQFWRAAYLLDKLAEKDAALVGDYIKPLVDALPTTANPSKLRHFLKLISQYPIAPEAADFLFGYCLETFTQPAFPVAVRVHALQILYEISEMEEGLKPELIHIIEHEMELHPTAGIKARGRNLLKRLRRSVAT